MRQHDPQGDDRLRIGWKEWVDLPDLGVRRMKAKVDTGARSSSLHCAAVEVRGKRVHMLIPHEGHHAHADEHPIRATARLADWVVVRNSGGDEEERPLIVTRLALGGIERTVRLTLTDRSEMLFPLLLGRTALDDVIIDPTARYLTGRRKRAR